MYPCMQEEVGFWMFLGTGDAVACPSYNLVVCFLFDWDAVFRGDMCRLAETHHSVEQLFPLAQVIVQVSQLSGKKNASLALVVADLSFKMRSPKDCQVWSPLLNKWKEMKVILTSYHLQASLKPDLDSLSFARTEQ